jgi:hypothetical protein
MMEIDLTYEKTFQSFPNKWVPQKRVTLVWYGFGGEKVRPQAWE